MRIRFLSGIRLGICQVVALVCALTTVSVHGASSLDASVGRSGLSAADQVATGRVATGQGTKGQGTKGPSVPSQNNSTQDSTGEVHTSPASLGWKEKSFAGHTHYSIVDHDGRRAIRAQTQGEASALYKGVKTNLRRTPFLNWDWKITKTYRNPNEQQKSGDDFPARVYVVYRKGFLPFNTLAINYVWSSTHPVNTHWPNAYSKKSHIVVVRSGDSEAGQWLSEKRDVAADFRQFFGIEVNRIDGFAVMVDGDNTGNQTTSWFASIDFSNH